MFCISFVKKQHTWLFLDFRFMVRTFDAQRENNFNCTNVGW